MTQRLTKEQAAIIGAFTGVSASAFSVIHEYAEHEFASEKLAEELKAAAWPDFMAIVYE